MRFQRILRRLTAVLLFVTVATPCMELLDRWDTVGGVSSDTEIHVFCWVLTISLILVVAMLLGRLFLRAMGRQTATSGLIFTLPFRLNGHIFFDYANGPTISPPVPLRI